VSESAPRVAVVGVGLIGGSIGLAAHKRLGASVAGFDSDAEALASALDAGAIDRAATSLDEAVADADLVFCATPVRSLSEIVAAACGAAPAGAVVTDVGSTKRGIVESVAGAEGGSRFIGGHPLAGAETAGVANARDDLFEGARWYLTPTEQTEGIAFDRLQRFLTEIGARPQAISAAFHDRMMATVSHLPHVLANVLVAQATETLAEESERMPEAGPSFRDATRVAGANPAIWNDIYAMNADALADEVEATAGRLSRIAEALRAGDAGALGDWQKRAGEQQKQLAEAAAGGKLVKLTLTVENRPGAMAEIALALGHAGVNIEDMALHPAADMKTGAVTMWIAGTDGAERAREIVEGLGHAIAAEES
jgi:prephenate dehydrogenase